MEILYITLYLIMAYIIGHFVYVFFVKDNGTNDTDSLPIILLSLIWPITLILIILSVLSPHLVQKQMMFQITSVPAKYLNQKQIKNVSSLWGKIKSLM